jgi:formate dehydrogenase iron-sulfur subunit
MTSVTPVGSAADPTASGLEARHSFVADGVEVGFFTDPSICIGCKACEVACKEWHGLPADERGWSGLSYDNTVALGATSWRHVKFVELDAPAMPQVSGQPVGWSFLSDVCKHCEHAGCLEACPTGSIIRTEVGSVYVQDDVCNGCGYCVVSCPFGVIDRRPLSLPNGGGAFKCTLCYDRQIDGLTPACAKACPTESILFGPVTELRAHAERRRRQLIDRGYADVRLYDPVTTSVGGIHASFLVLGDPERFGLPPAPEVPTVHLPVAWASALITIVTSLGLVWVALGGGG